MKQLDHKSDSGTLNPRVWKGSNSSYLALARKFPIRPISSHDELDEAIAMLDYLLSRRKPLDQQEQGYFDSLTNEIHRYETAAVPIPPVTGVDMLKFLIEQKEVTLSEVAAGAGIALSTLSAILASKRSMNLTHMNRLGPYFGVEAAVFV